MGPLHGQVVTAQPPTGQLAARKPAIPNRSRLFRTDAKNRLDPSRGDFNIGESATPIENSFKKHLRKIQHIAIVVLK
jgi:hypothetical protein